MDSVTVPGLTNPVEVWSPLMWENLEGFRILIKISVTTLAGSTLKAAQSISLHSGSPADNFSSHQAALTGMRLEMVLLEFRNSTLSAGIPDPLLALSWRFWMQSTPCAHETKLQFSPAQKFPTCATVFPCWNSVLGMEMDSHPLCFSPERGPCASGTWRMPQRVEISSSHSPPKGRAGQGRGHRREVISLWSSSSSGSNEMLSFPVPISYLAHSRPSLRLMNGARVSQLSVFCHEWMCPLRDQETSTSSAEFMNSSRYVSCTDTYIHIYIYIHIYFDISYPFKQHILYFALKKKSLSAALGKTHWVFFSPVITGDGWAWSDCVLLNLPSTCQHWKCLI